MQDLCHTIHIHMYAPTLPCTDAYTGMHTRIN